MGPARSTRPQQLQLASPGTETSHSKPTPRRALLCREGLREGSRWPWAARGPSCPRSGGRGVPGAHCVVSRLPHRCTAASKAWSRTRRGKGSRTPSSPWKASTMTSAQVATLTRVCELPSRWGARRSVEGVRGEWVLQGVPTSARWMARQCGPHPSPVPAPCCSL